MSEGIERYEEGLGSVERLVGRGKTRIEGWLVPHKIQNSNVLQLILLR